MNGGLTRTAIFTPYSERSMTPAMNSVPEALVLDASAVAEALIGTTIGARVRARMRGCELHAPAHLDAEVLFALGRLHRAGDLDDDLVFKALSELASAPIRPARLTQIASITTRPDR